MRIFLILSLFLVSCVTPQVAINRKADFSKIKRVAVLNFSGPNGEVASEIFTITLLKHGADVVERKQLDSVIKELNLSRSDLLDSKTRKKIGKLLSVDALFTGTVLNYKPNTRYIMQNSKNSFQPVTEIKGKNVYTQVLDPLNDTKILETTAEIGLSVRMIDIETGSIMWSGYLNYEGLDVPSTIQSISEFLVKSLIPIWPSIN